MFWLASVMDTNKFNLVFIYIAPKILCHKIGNDLTELWALLYICNIHEIDKAHSDCWATNYHQVKLQIVFCVKELIYDTLSPELQGYAKKTTRYRSLVYVKQLVLDIDKAMMISTIALVERKNWDILVKWLLTAAKLLVKVRNAYSGEAKIRHLV